MFQKGKICTVLSYGRSLFITLRRKELLECGGRAKALTLRSFPRMSGIVVHYLVVPGSRRL